MRISDPFREAGWWFRVGEHDFELRCTCGARQRADALRRHDRGDVTLYECAHCGTQLIGVAVDDRAPAAAPGMAPADDDGHRMCGFVFASTVDMTLRSPGSAEGDLDIPARPRFFRSRGRN